MAHGTTAFRYVGSLVKAGWSGARAARSRSGRSAGPPASLGILLGPALLGAGIGAWTAAAGKERRSRREIAAGGFLGGAIGLGAGAAWASRAPAGAAARGAIRSINAARDAHWLEKHPIAYA